ncbi:MAG TPA: bifunctional serine/threonine-protein kinase/formylglycine-generating enzyme family protein [Polyangia bacterium]|jgi:serine/threonine-protein kinase
MLPDDALGGLRRLTGDAHRRGWLDDAAFWSITGHLHAGRAFEAQEELKRQLGPERLRALDHDTAIAGGFDAALADTENGVRGAAAVTAAPAASPTVAPPAQLTDYLAQLTASLLSAPPPRLTHVDLGADDAADVAAASAAEEPPPADGRYRIAKELGRGGSGRVFAAEDLHSGRLAALKVLNQKAKESPDLVRRFINEARITAQLEHPGIVPVYDVGMLPSGEPFYTMRVVGRHSLAGILWDPAVRRDYPLVRLIAIFDQVCCSLGYAHSRGVVHRDVKPENILVGNFGEVYLTDWGIARVIPAGGAEPAAETAGQLTSQSAFLGTPGYMPPEQIVDPTSVDARADVFALGVVLYEILTGTSPFHGQNAVETLRRTLAEEPKPPCELNPQAPLLLGELCLRCLARDPAARPRSMAEVVGDLQAFLEGSKERERQRQAAAELVRRAGAVKATCLALRDERDRLLGESARALDAVRPYDDVSRKARAWEDRGRAAQAEREAEEAFGEATVLYSQALARDPDSSEAKRALAELYWVRMVEAEARRDEGDRAFFERLMRQHDDGTHAARLRAKARLVIASTPPGAAVRVARLSNLGGVYVPGHARALGATPLTHELPAGDLLVTVAPAEGAPVRLHLELRRGEEHRAEVRLRARDEVGAGLVLVAAGRVTLGGDPDAPGALSRREVDLADFALAEYPVTVGEYCEFLDALELEQARRHAPRDNDGNLRGVAHADGRWAPLPTLLGRQHAADPCTDELRRDLARLPVGFVDWHDAVAYCRWRTEREGREVRLPTENEWEKAARGADRRAFPWGEFFDATFCKMRDSREGPAAPEPVGAFERDTSPYGVHDLAGGVREWVADVEGERSAAALLAAGPADDGARILRGGSWAGVGAECRAAARFRAAARLHRWDAGFRVARTVG